MFVTHSPLGRATDVEFKVHDSQITHLPNILFDNYWNLGETWNSAKVSEIFAHDPTSDAQLWSARRSHAHASCTAHRRGGRESRNWKRSSKLAEYGMQKRTHTSEELSISGGTGRKVARDSGELEIFNSTFVRFLALAHWRRSWILHYNWLVWKLRCYTWTAKASVPEILSSKQLGTEITSLALHSMHGNREGETQSAFLRNEPSFAFQLGFSDNNIRDWWNLESKTYTMMDQWIKIEKPWLWARRILFSWRSAY